jgi:hypothetical protein
MRLGAPSTFFWGESRQSSDRKRYLAFLRPKKLTYPTSRNQNNLLSFCSLLERYRQWMAPLLATISESLAPGWLQDLGGSLCGERPRYKSGNLQLPQPRSTSSHSPTLSRATFDVCPPILRWGPCVRLSSYLGGSRSGCLNPSWCCPSIAYTSETPPLSCAERRTAAGASQSAP